MAKERETWGYRHYYDRGKCFSTWMDLHPACRCLLRPSPPWLYFTPTEWQHNAPRLSNSTPTSARSLLREAPWIYCLLSDLSLGGDLSRIRLCPRLSTTRAPGLRRLLVLKQHSGGLTAGLGQSFPTETCRGFFAIQKKTPSVQGWIRTAVCGRPKNCLDWPASI